jgi:VIT1/CCC1 family predicted Fe2+/Mn2+ transporter
MRDGTGAASPPADARAPGRNGLLAPSLRSTRDEAGARLASATTREILMGAQDNLTNVLAVVLGVAIGSGRADLVVLAGLSAATAEAVSMGGVLYSATRADMSRARRLDADGSPSAQARLGPVLSGLTTFVAAMVAGVLPLVPFAFLALPEAAAAAIALSLAALFGLGAVTGRVSGNVWWRDGLRLIVVAGLAAMAAATVGVILGVD